ncbi:MAG: UDP-glucose 4-epimerase GalE [Aquincola sp.]|nr:UDP-glucose 4-epimerase GalE [Aquincola sp.]MDH4289870.1 UDP-glucose 4-epimerase GalE [Aquincola sp.]MDH5331711.1 UDP-glucose 4-epimerase GalE [Aquincola sp.]
MPKILLTGASGYIASHTWLALWNSGFDVVGVDDFRNSSPAVLERLRRISGRSPAFVQVDVCDAAGVDRVFQSDRFDAVVHFAALKAVGESVAQPLAYYRNNVGGLLTVCDAMLRHGCLRMVYSSSATVYGDPTSLPIREDAPLFATNPYGQTKLIGERVLADLAIAQPRWQTACLRYFNPVGAHESGLIGEDPRGTPNNLMPYVSQVAVGRRPKLRVFGNDYPTADGTGVRDYIHVCDLAEGHVAAVRRLLQAEGSFTVNLGTGRGHSVLEVIRAYERSSGRTVPFEVVARRPGDVAACYADPSRANELLAWRASRGLDQMCTDSWRWQQMNPNGFETESLLEAR